MPTSTTIVDGVTDMVGDSIGVVWDVLITAMPAILLVIAGLIGFTFVLRFVFSKIARPKG